MGLASGLAHAATPVLALHGACPIQRPCWRDRPGSTGNTARRSNPRGPPLRRKVNRPPGVARPIPGTSIHLRHDSRNRCQSGQADNRGIRRPGRQWCGPVPNKPTRRAHAREQCSKMCVKRCFSALHNGQSPSTAESRFSTSFAFRAGLCTPLHSPTSPRENVRRLDVRRPAKARNRAKMGSVARGRYSVHTSPGKDRKSNGRLL